MLTQVIVLFQEYDPNAVKVVNGSGKVIGHIAKDKAAALSPKMKEIQENLLHSQHLQLIVEGTIISVSDGYQQSVQVEFKEAEVEVIVLE